MNSVHIIEEGTRDDFKRCALGYCVAMPKRGQRCKIAWEAFGIVWWVEHINPSLGIYMLAASGTKDTRYNRLISHVGTLC